MAPNAHLEHLKGPVAQVFIEGKGLLAQGPAVIHDLDRISLTFGLAGLSVKHRLDAERQEAVPLVLLGNIRHCQYLPINLSASKVTSRFYDSYGCMHVP